ncbi:MAG: hypothetical protein JST90_15455 [Bacteroidetes bacterium]|nr:hypothetical protein [Bacteroidota bacterium]
MPITFLKPQEFAIPNGELLAELSIDIFQVKQFGCELSIPITIAALSKDFAGGQKPQINVGDLSMEELHQRYYDIKMLTFHCAWLGEVLLERLKGVNDFMISGPSNKASVAKFLADKGRQYEKLDFIAHKDLLCAVLKEREKSIALSFDRKTFCTLFDEIIVQRNNFIHGKLFMLQTSAGYQTILHSDKGYQIIEKDTLNSYNECYNNISAILSQSSQFLKDHP